MQKRTIILAMALMAAMSFPAGVAAKKSKDHNFDISKNLTIFNDVFREADMLYVDTVDVENIIHKAIDAMLGTLDPYTQYFPEEEEKDFKMMTTGKYGGMGAAIRLYPKKDYVAIVEPYEGKPAAKSGLKAGDLILSIDGESMKGKSSQYVSEHLRGDAGTSFTVTINRPGEKDSIDVTINRETIAMPAVPCWCMRGNTGYIMLSDFTDGCSKEVRQAVLELKSKGATSLILDLRGNGGGLMTEAIEIVGMFVPKGTKVLETKGKLKQAQATYSTTRDPIDTDIPLAVLVDGESASASEIVSGSLQDLDRAVIMGQRTFGKGLVQTSRGISYNGIVKITSSKYYIPSGRCIQEIDYSNGKSRTPDSLTNVFHTAGGREVRDGGGIRPDIVCTEDTMPDIMYYLSTDMALFDFVTDYCVEHQSIAPLAGFSVSDSLMAEFKQYVRKSDFQYTSRSSQALKQLLSIAEFEGLAAGAKEEFDALQTKLQYDMDRDLDLFEEDLRKLLTTEIITRYYWNRGAIEKALDYDSGVKSATELLSDQSRYTALLAGK